LELGAKVIGIGRDGSKIQDIIAAFPETFVFQSINLSEPFNPEFSFNEFIEKNGKLNGMVYCAGKEETFPISMYSSEKLDDILNVNFKAPFELLRMLSKKKTCYDSSSFVFLSSVMGELGQPGKTAYCSSKAAILGLVRAAALELAPRAIRVNAISPGIVDTPMTQKLFSLLDADNKKRIVDMHPLGLGKVDDVIPLILFLLSDGSRWITGQNIKVDGGYSVK
jgi:NAD(P)-dependent dehydrogenase (short-subunit alcohol dehydrogenase family)